MNTPFRNLWMALGTGLALLVLLSCQRGNNSSAEKPTVALVLKTLNNPFFIDMERGAREAARKLGVRLLVQAAERELDVEKQMQIIVCHSQRFQGDCPCHRQSQSGHHPGYRCRYSSRFPDTAASRGNRGGLYWIG